MFQSGPTSPPFLYSVQFKKNPTTYKNPPPPQNRARKYDVFLSNLAIQDKRQMMNKVIRRVTTPQCPKKCSGV